MPKPLPISMIAGILLWYAFGRYLFSGKGWFFCFAGYPAAAGGFGGILYLYDHDFR